MNAKNPSQTKVRMRLSRMPRASRTSTVPMVGAAIYSMAPRTITKKMPMAERYPPYAVRVKDYSAVAT